MFERVHHQKIARILEALNGPLLAQHQCFFGGGTALALKHGEYRLSNDVDFLVSDLPGYRALRQLLTGPLGIGSIARSGMALHALREIRADQYGIRTWLRIDDADIKFEIVLEGRIELETPSEQDRIGEITTLTELDLATSKLLANSDRWADDGVFSRDLIDLAMMQPRKTLRQRALLKAQRAYGDSVEADLRKAIAHVLGRPGRLERCMLALQMTLPKAQLWQRIKALEAR